MTDVTPASMFSGCYDANRAAALSGVPKSTIYWWARQEIVVPSVSPVQEKLWSFGDLMALRIVHWLRHVKPEAAIKASPMPRVRQALAMLDHNNLDLWDAAEGRSPILVDPRGRIFVRLHDEVVGLDGAHSLPDLQTWGLTEAFTIDGQVMGPDLLRPRQNLRIVPGKVSGEPHVVDTRITSLALASLSRDGFATEQIADMYDLPEGHVEDAVSLERDLGTLEFVA